MITQHGAFARAIPITQPRRTCNIHISITYISRIQIICLNLHHTPIHDHHSSSLIIVLLYYSSRTCLNASARSSITITTSSSHRHLSPSPAPYPLIRLSAPKQTRRGVHGPGQIALVVYCIQVSHRYRFLLSHSH